MDLLELPFDFNNLITSPIGYNNIDIELNDSYIVLDPNVKLPIHSFNLNIYSNVIKYLNVEILKKYLNRKLSEVEGIRFNYNEQKFKWKLEWGTTPLEYTINDYNIQNTIKKTKMFAIKAANKAIIKYPHNEDTQISYFIYSEIYRWFKAQILLSYNPESKQIIISYDRLMGDVGTFYYILGIIKSYFDDPRNISIIEREGIIAERLNYLRFIEGTIDNSNNIKTRILFNEDNMKEICSYL